MSKIINIAYNITENSWKMAIVSMQSVIDNNSNNKLRFYIFYSYNTNIIFQDKFKFYAKYKNVEDIIFIKIDDSKFKFLSNYVSSYINLSHHFYCFDYINQIKEEKILLLVEHTIVTNDLSDFYNMDLTNKSCAVSVFPFIDPLNLNLKNNNSFIFNDLVMLINLKYWKENNFYENLLNKEYLNSATDIPFSYLDLINYIIKEPKLVSLKYNYSEDYSSRALFGSNSIKNTYKKLLLHIEKPLIISYIGPTTEGGTPYENSYASLWWKYAEQTPIYNEIKEFKNSNKYKLSATSAQNSFKYTWLLSRIFPYIKPYIPRILIGFAIAIPLGLLDGVTALALKPYMDYVVGGKALEFSILSHQISISSLTMAFILPIGVILFAVFQGVLKYLNDYISAWTSQRITNDVKFDLFHRLIHMHPQFYDDNSSGIVISRYMGDPGTASAGIVDQIKTITTSLCGALGLIAVMIYSSWKLAFIGVLVLCIAFIPVALIRKRIKETSNKNMVIGGNITTNINETYSGNKVMAAYDLQDRQENYFKTQVWKSFNINMSLTKRAAWMSPLMYLIASFGIAIVLGYGTYLINTGHMTPGSFASFVTSLLLLYKPVKTLGGTLTGIQNIFVAMGRVFELFDLDSAIKDPENPLEMKGLNSLIEFKNVCFEYVPGQPVLKNINLKVDKNETIAIVGNSGGGKSTIVNLLPRFYDIKSGSIEFDGTDIRKFSLKSLRHNISMVFQDNFLFSGTIKENIMMGNPDATVDELMEAIKSAHLQDMIAELPEGLETELGERGLTLSGGQRQRVAIARAMLRNAPIVILDEATSALDNESEAIVQKAMDNLMQNKTVFIIAHRLSTIKNADRIAVINEGELVELGTHEELMQIENGQYKHLYEMQFKREVKVG